MGRAVALAAIAAACVTLAGARAAGDPAPDAARGHAFLQTACSRCHAVDPGRASPDARAPAFPDFASARSDSDLMQAFSGAEARGHRRMPPDYITPWRLDDIVAYLRSLNGRRGPARLVPDASRRSADD